jgi:putative sterol carrier protein
MADVQDFFTNYLPKKLSENPSIAKDINAIYVFDIDGAGQWTVDLTSGGKIEAGAAANPGCVVSAKKADFESLLDNPSGAMMLFMQGKLKVTNVGLALSLQKILS